MHEVCVYSIHGGLRDLKKGSRSHGSENRPDT
jgi:hypothetical protein